MYDATLKIIAVAKVKANIVIHIFAAPSPGRRERDRSLSHRSPGKVNIKTAATCYIEVSLSNA
jgi:hypothetical protein